MLLLGYRVISQNENNKLRLQNFVGTRQITYLLWIFTWPFGYFHNFDYLCGIQKQKEMKSTKKLVQELIEYHIPKSVILDELCISRKTFLKYMRNDSFKKSHRVVILHKWDWLNEK